MDAVEKLHDNFLSCSICLERYKDPCTLPCGHTFCRICLGKFTNTRPDVIQAKSILCPFCKQMSAVPDPSKPAVEWPKQFKPHILMQGLLDTFELQQDTNEGTRRGCCFSCQQLGETTTATSLCQECEVVFCDRCAKMHTAMLGMGTHVMSGLTGDSKVTQSRKVICKEHKSLVEFCCRDCNTAVCQKCCIDYHSTCHDVVTIDAMSSEMKTFLQQKLKTLKVTLQDIKSSLFEKQSQVDEVTSRKASLLSEIRQTSGEAIALIKQKEKQLTDRLDDLTKQQTGQLKGQIKSEEIDLQMYQQYCYFIQQALRNESPTDLYERYQMLKSSDRSEETKTSSRDQKPVSPIPFVKKFDKQSFAEDAQLGFLTCSADEHPHAALPVCQIIDPFGDKDQTLPDPNDIIAVDVDGVETLVVTDSINENVKSFFTKKNMTHVSTLTLEDAPFTVTELKSKLVVVSFYLHVRKFIIVEVTPDLTLVSKVSTRKAYRSLTSISSTALAAGSYDPPSIDIIDLSGRIMRSLNVRTSLTHKPWYMSTTIGGHILVCDEGSASVYCLTTDGRKVFTYRPTTGRAMLKRPLGITTMDNGDILVADYDANKVVQLTETGHFVRDMLTPHDCIFQPQGLCFHRNKLYVTQEFGKVKVFDLSQVD